MFFLGQNLSILPQLILLLTYFAGIATVSLNLEKWIADPHDSHVVQVLNEASSNYHVETTCYDLNKENIKLNKKQSGFFIPKRLVFITGYHFRGYYHSPDRIRYTLFVKFLFSRPPPINML